MTSPVDGIYRIETAMDTSLTCDVANESLSNKANLMIFGQNQGISYAGNHQRFRLLTNGAYRQLQACHSGKMIEVFGKTSKPVGGENISQYNSNGGNNQKWTITDEISSNGSACHAIRSAMGSSFVMDAEYAIAKPGTNVFLCAWNAGDNQKWVFVRDSFWYPQWSVPANVGMATSQTGAAASTLALPGGVGTLYPAWLCDGERFQLRYRWRGRDKGRDTWSDWVEWREPSGSTANAGWGDPWVTDLTDATPGNLKHYMPGIQVAMGEAYDKMQYQVEVQRFEPNGYIGNINAYGPIHGGSATGTVNVIARPTVTIQKVAFAPDGLRIAYLSDFERGGNSVSSLTVKCAGKTLVSGWSAKSLAHAGTLVIPFSQLAFIPDDGASCAVSCKFATIDTSINVSQTLALAYDAGYGFALAPTFENADGYTVLARIKGATSSACYLQTEQDGRTRFVACDEESSGVFRVAPAFGVPYRVFLVAKAGGTWGTKVVDMPAIKGARACIWSSASGWCALAFNAEVVYSAARDHEAVQTNGRPRESIFLGEGFAGSVSVTGTVVPEYGVEHGGVDAFNALQGDARAVFRTPAGERFDVMVLAIEHSMKNLHVREVSVTMKERA